VKPAAEPATTGDDELDAALSPSEKDSKDAS
jgi:hypothetical protein